MNHCAILLGTSAHYKRIDLLQTMHSLLFFRPE